MISMPEKLAALMSRMPIYDIDPVYAARRAADNAASIAFDQALIRTGAWEIVESVSIGQSLTDDGREILRAHGNAWALKPEIHAQRLAEAMEQARQRDAAIAPQQAQQQTACTALIDGQLCGGTLVRAAVCPRCALGKSGVTATLTCDVCGHVSAIMRGDS